MHALFDRAPRLRDLVPYVALADGLPTPLVAARDGLWVKREDATDSRYGGNKVRKLEHLLAVASRRGGTVLTAGAMGSHHVVAVGVHAGRLGLSVEAVRFPQPASDHVAAMSARAEAVGVRSVEVGASAAMPFVLAQRLAALRADGPATLVTPGGSTPLGTLGYVAAGLELVDQCAAEPDEVVVPLGSGGSAVGLALGMALGGWRQAVVRAVRVADRIVTNAVVLRGIELGVRELLALGGVFPPAARLRIDGRWFGAGYGHPTPVGVAAAAEAPALGLSVEPTYTAKGLAAALSSVAAGRRTVWVHTYAGE